MTEISKSSLAATFVRMAKFGAVGVANTAIDVGVFSALYLGAGTPVLWANTIGYCSGTVNSFLMNKYWTFGDSRSAGRISRQFPKFLVFNLAGLGISNLVLWALQETMHVFAAKGVALIATFLWNYWTSRRFVYGAR
ncbi:MAG: GtrA family protein [Alphaproteobacteria bacterium]|nr:GtrA family protein [Alphaproteobacteria bacterium]